MTLVEAILAASSQGDYGQVLKLLDQDHSLANATTMLGSQPIHAAYFGGHEQVVDLLLAHGVQLDVFLASQLGKLDLVRRALDADPQIAGAFSAAGSTALHGACYWGQVAVANLLLERGADPNAVTRDGFLQIRPLGCAVATPDISNPSDQEAVVFQLVAQLLAAGADVNGRRRDGLTALHSAAYRGHLRVMELLLRHGADPTLRGLDGLRTGQTALDMALGQNQDAAAAFLKDYAHHG